jgi:hypothetical protein
MHFFLWWSDSIHGIHLAQIFLYPEMLAENFVKKGSRNLREFLTQLVKSQAPILSNLFVNLFFQVLSDERWVPRSLFVMNISPVCMKHSTPLPHTRVIHYTFNIQCRKLSTNVNSADILCLQTTDHRSHFTVGGIITFLHHFKHSQKLFKWCNRCETYLKKRQRTTEVERPWISTESWPARELCTNGLYFLDDPRTIISAYTVELVLKHHQLRRLPTEEVRIKKHQNSPIWLTLHTAFLIHNCVKRFLT